LYMELVL